MSVRSPAEIALKLSIADKSRSRSWLISSRMTCGSTGASLAWALMSVGAVKGFEVGEGFASARMRGSEMNDAMVEGGGFASNRAGGILGGISTGEPIVVRIAVKPPSSISVAQKTVDVKGHERDLEVHGRHDPCLCPRVVPVAEAMVCLTLADAWLRQRAIEPWKPKAT